MALPAKMCHTFHPNHELSLVTTTGWFTGGFMCDGCNQPGKSSECYGCEPCNFTLHTHCATAPAVLQHTLFVDSSFVLIEDQTTQNGYMTCQACGGETVGFRYFNKEPYMYLHPCCAVLPTSVIQDDRVFQLLKNSAVKCGICKDKSESSLSYRTSYDDGEHVYLHVSCLVKTNNELTGYKNWVASAPIRPGVLGSLARLSASASAVTHELHPKHKLSLVNTPPSGFKCDVCKGWGEGSQHYRCVPCNFDAHIDCATAPATFKHVNYDGDFVLRTANTSGHYHCAVCGRETLGYRYYNADLDLRLHPCCAFLQRRVVQDGRAFQLGYYASGMCGMCKKNTPACLSYRSTYDDGKELYLHVRCLVDTNNKLTGYQDWVASAPIRPGVLGSFTRAASTMTTTATSSAVYTAAASSSSSSTGDKILKGAKVSFSAVRLVLHVATFDFGGAAEAVADIADAIRD